jgi:hypothetical protein
VIHVQRAAPCLALVLACHSSSAEPAAITPVEASVAPSVQDAAVDALAALPTSAVEASAPAPVTVENIGMHIGGGPNDAVSKAPIGGSVAPHFDAFRACWAQTDDASKAGDFGVDLLIPAEGGRAAVSHPRTSLGPQAFRDCVVVVFTGIDFARPRTGRTTVSYSLRFTPVQ